MGGSLKAYNPYNKQTGYSNNASSGSSFGSSGGGLTPIATTKTENRNTSGSKQGSSASVTNSNTNFLENTLFNKQNMTAEGLAALTTLINQGGSNPLLASQDEGKKRNQDLMERMLLSLDPSRASEMASGRTAELSRQLKEQVLPDLFGGAEAAGFGGDALSSLMAQDAAIRTGEAQARVEEEVRSNVQNQATQASQVLNELLSSGSGVMDSLLAALEVSKGAVNTGSENRVGSTQERGTTTDVSQESSSENVNLNSSILDPIAWARLQTELDIANSGASSGPSAAEKKLAAFNASKGPFMSLSNYKVGGNNAENDLMNQLSRMGF